MSKLVAKANYFYQVECVRVMYMEIDTSTLQEMIDQLGPGVNLAGVTSQEVIDFVNKDSQAMLAMKIAGRVQYVSNVLDELCLIAPDLGAKWAQVGEYKLDETEPALAVCTEARVFF